MPRYLRVAGEPAAVCCYQCGAGFGFFDYDQLPQARCGKCSTPLFLPHELEGIGKHEANPLTQRTISAPKRRMWTFTRSTIWAAKTRMSAIWKGSLGLEISPKPEQAPETTQIRSRSIRQR
jgi:hypothetical protein